MEVSFGHSTAVLKLFVDGCVNKAQESKGSVHTPAAGHI